MRIFIATGIYPPDIGGPAQYAKNLKDSFQELGHQVVVKYFQLEKKLPTVVRHFYYFFKSIPAVYRSDAVFALDTFSVALPSILLAKLFFKKFIIRTGGDFLWEFYVERTGNLVLFKNFYKTARSSFSFKERLIFIVTGIILRNSDAVIFSTNWQKEIFIGPYRLDPLKLFVVENYYGNKEESFKPEKKNFLAGTRPLKWKNDARLAQAFLKVREKDESLEYDNTTVPFGTFMDKVAHAYAVVLVSLGDISPNLILDAIRHNKPFILTRETGLYDRVKECALFVDPENIDDIVEKIHWLSVPENYELQKKKVESFMFTHTWESIAGDFLEVYKKT